MLPTFIPLGHSKENLHTLSQSPSIIHTCATYEFALYLAQDFFAVIFFALYGNSNSLVPYKEFYSFFMVSQPSSTSFCLLLGIYPIPIPEEVFLDPTKILFKCGLTALHTCCTGDIMRLFSGLPD